MRAQSFSQLFAPRLDRRAWLGGALASLGLPALAQFRVEISGVGGSQLPIAIPDFRDEARAGQPVAAIIRADLERSGQFRIIDAAPGLHEASAPVWSEWRSRQADALAAGSAMRSPPATLR